MLIRDANISDFEEITKIYNYYIKETVITFEEEEIDKEEMIKRFEKIKKSGLPWLVAQKDGEILGYAYAHFWHDRSAYRFSVEPSIYLNKKFIGNGVGKALYKQLLTKLKELGIKNALGLITVPNDASIALHEKFGFKKVGELPNIGIKFDKWLNVGLWQLEM
ncbi:GNAT family N-acetyltransferase [Halarcobacter ebronensis]|uniref:Phosphinothricin acetyltransferase n=1 Tax=Halarcobacter ebronensis TaxID=1462615 RepID=A0A4Q1AQP2_9BACT|nr:GNAT family N-acetyltransferase [Halarcobacter ebronensis]QKF82350.1 acetyltransferase (GNAT family) [Halarcobacter ebronensis]RXK07622.1 phosphinothricin acetyltransferase [Halarcobacter ebronensis]